MDTVDFPMLANAAFNQAFGFMFNCLSSALRRDKKKKGEEPLEKPDVVEGELHELVPREEVVKAHLSELRGLAGELLEYKEDPELLDPNDKSLRESLGRLRALLEKIYGQHITFRGESRPRSGVKVEYRVGTVSGELVGIDAKRVREGRVVADIQEVKTDGSVIGIRADSVGD
ncbi:hypothetical protein [Saccharopolyspora pogona]|uniref:hypothetical protein n=1 Tax=Saccharopolyspora pogona TaxID=333966 RepID=UPI001689CE7E|nr:hypothetical protein [Saccharopolyspora pogona]